MNKKLIPKIAKGFKQKIHGCVEYTNEDYAEKQKILLGKDSIKREKVLKQLTSIETIDNLFPTVYTHCTCGSKNFKLVIDFGNQYSIVCPKCKVHVIDWTTIQETYVLKTQIKSIIENKRRIENKGECLERI